MKDRSKQISEESKFIRNVAKNISDNEQRQIAREKKAKEFEEMILRDWIFNCPPVIEWNCKGYLGKKS